MGINLHEHGWDNVKIDSYGESASLPPDGYICQIVNAELSQTNKGFQKIILHIDIVEGEYTGYFRKQTEYRKKFKPDTPWHYTGIYDQFLYEKNSNNISKIFKHLINTLMRCNPHNNINTHNFEVTSLRGLLVGFVFGEKEFSNPSDNSIYIKTVPRLLKTVADIREHKFKIPERKKLEEQAAPSAADNIPAGASIVDNDDMPF